LWDWSVFRHEDEVRRDLGANFSSRPAQKLEYVWSSFKYHFPAWPSDIKFITFIALQKLYLLHDHEPSFASFFHATQIRHRLSTNSRTNLHNNVDTTYKCISATLRHLVEQELICWSLSYFFLCLISYETKEREKYFITWLLNGFYLHIYIFNLINFHLNINSINNNEQTTIK